MTALPLPTDRPLWTLEQLADRLAEEPRLTVVGASPGATSLAVRQLRRRVGRPLVVVTRDADSAKALLADLEFVLGAASPSTAGAAVLFDAGEASPYSELIPDRRSGHARLAALYHLATLGESGSPAIFVLAAAALPRKLVAARSVRERCIELVFGEAVDRDALLHTLIGAGYLRVPLVEDPGTVAVRGSLFDVWSPGQPRPVRIDFDGDAIASLAPFDPNDQRRGDELEAVTLLPASEVRVAEADGGVEERLRDLCDRVDWPSSKTRVLIEDVVQGRAFFGADGFLPAFGPLLPLHAQLPRDAVLVLEEPSAIEAALEAEMDRAETEALAKQGQPHFPVEAFYCDRGQLDAWLAARSVVALCQSPVELAGDGPLADLGRVDDDTPTIASHDQGELSRAVSRARLAGGQGDTMDAVAESVRSWREASLRVVFTARTSSQAERLATMLSHRDLEVTSELDELDLDRLLARSTRAPWITVTVGELERGVLAPLEGISLVTEEEVFGHRAHRQQHAKRPGKRRAAQMLEDLRSLAVGDHVVHVDHGVGRYEGLIHRRVGEHLVDLLVVAYAGGDKLYVPVYRLDQIHKLQGADASPTLDRLGGQTFARAKAKARKKVRDIADELLALYAERESAVGVATPAVDDEYRAFEATFPFEETEDQARAIIDVNADLEAERPMDRLVCGDVGFGKTEVALRAAFRVAMAGRQVAVLCPTTVLAQQHKMTFDARLGAYPLQIAMLSRFQPKKRADAIARGVRDGKIDVVIGTHRLLSKDVHFKRLGLLVVDEEQRFGVTAKERIKALKANVDVLTLTATPIPRTLQMAIAGLRDLSLMTTAPADRRAVRTVVTRPDPLVLKEALQRELGRGGQVYFVYNRIGGLEERAAMVHQLVPEARIAVAHGRMAERTLERTMVDFVEGRYDILCSTAIVENGLDIPRCNTIIIDRADLFGLGQLYQLRGRVGRSRDRGYCYLVLPPGGALADEARMRIEALQRYGELGSGFQIASLDLDLRGGGDLLGAEQSGVVASVGLDLFCRMLEEATAELRGETVVHDVDPELAFDVEALLPETYIHDVGVRLSFYKRLASAYHIDEVRELSEEMEDRFGRAPPPARRYIRMMTLKTELRELRALACEASARAVTLHLRDDTPIDAAKLTSGLRGGSLPYRLTPDMRLSRRCLPGEEHEDGLSHCQRLLTELRSYLR